MRSTNSKLISVIQFSYILIGSRIPRVIYGFPKTLNHWLPIVTALKKNMVTPLNTPKENKSFEDVCSMIINSSWLETLFVFIGLYISLVLFVHLQRSPHPYLVSLLILLQVGNVFRRKVY